MDISPITIHKKIIDQTLTDYLRKKQGESINELQRDLLDKLLSFTISGKSIRGCLAVFGFLLFSQEKQSQIFDVAAALELLHSGLLIHDDIMDRDEVRRGRTSIYAQYEEHGVGILARDSKHFGVSMGINAADFCFFAGFELLGNSQSDVSKLISSELMAVVAAQMQDVSASLTQERLLEADILSVYRYKTARYTFSLPLVVGAKLAGVSEPILSILDRIGENIGILFQIRDDELNLFGDPAKTGKSIGGDIREHKQTLLLLYLAQENSTINLQSLSQEALTKIYIDRGIQAKIVEKLSDLRKSVIDDIAKLPINEENKKLLQTLAEFVQTREN